MYGISNGISNGISDVAQEEPPDETLDETKYGRRQALKNINHVTFSGDTFFLCLDCQGKLIQKFISLVRQIITEYCSFSTYNTIYDHPKKINVLLIGGGSYWACILL